MPYIYILIHFIRIMPYIYVLISFIRIMPYFYVMVYFIRIMLYIYVLFYFIRIMPWSYGIRKCLGENTVRGRMFLYLSSLVQNFKFLPPAEGALPEPDPRNYLPGIILKPMPYNCRMVLRK